MVKLHKHHLHRLSRQVLKVPIDKINVNGGAIAHGHPLGATGAILMTKMVPRPFVIGSVMDSAE